VTLALTAFAVFALGIPTAYAQIEEIVVTARGVEESVREIPVAITVVNEKLMQDLSLYSFEDVAAVTPALNIIRGTSGNGASINIRGIGVNTSSIGIEQSVAAIIDQVYYPQGRVINEGLFDVRQVSVMKGPQALFFGKNATAGVMAIETNNPGDELEIMGRWGYETEEEVSTGELIVSGPLTERIGARLALRGLRGDGYMNNSAGATTYATLDAATFTPTVHSNPAPESSHWPDEESFFGRLTLTAEATERLSFNFKASYADFEISSTNGGQEGWACPTLGGLPHINVGGVPVFNPAAECKRDLTRGNNPIPPTIAATNPLLSEFGGELGEDYESYTYTATANLALDDFDITAILNYHDQETNWVGDFDGGGLTAVFAGENNTFDAFSTEVRAVTQLDGPFNFVGGFYYQETERTFDQDVIFAGAENSAAVDPTDVFTAYEKASETDGETISLYGEVIWDFAERWQLTAGARWIDEEKDSFFEQPYVNPFFVGLFLEGRVADDQDFDEIVPEVTLRFEPTDDMTIYAAYKEGYKSGGFSNSVILGNLSGTLQDFVFDPEEVEGFEVGMKGTLFDDTFSYEVEAYSYEFENLQIDFFNSAQFAFITDNAGSSETEGAEAQFVWAPKFVDGLTFSGAVAYNDAEYEDFISPCYAGQTPALGCTILIPGLVPQQQLGGTERSLAPEWAGFLGANYEREFGNGLTLGLTLNFQYKDDHLIGTLGHVVNVQDDYTTLDAAVRLGGPLGNGRWQVAVIAKNWTDEYAVLFAGDTPSTGGGNGTPGGWFADQAATVTRPRTIELQVTYWFGG
jgi:outer membrane receptor protein involved in Fe transport